jgi:hypothetical protein
MFFKIPNLFNSPSDGSSEGDFKKIRDFYQRRQRDFFLEKMECLKTSFSVSLGVTGSCEPSAAS